MSYDTIQEDGTNLTSRTTLNFATALTASDDSPNSRTNVNLAVTASADGGAVAAQTSLPGTLQSKYFCLSGGRVEAGSKDSNAVVDPSLQVGSATKGLFQAATNDLGIAANAKEVVRFGPTTGNVARQSRFSGPMLIGTLSPDAGESNALYDLHVDGGDNALEVVRVTPRVTLGAPNTIFVGLNVVNDTGTGNDVAHNGFFHGIQANVAVNSPNVANESSAGEFFMFQYGLGSTFGPRPTPT